MKNQNKTLKNTIATASQGEDATNHHQQPAAIAKEANQLRSKVASFFESSIRHRQLSLSDFVQQAAQSEKNSYTTDKNGKKILKKNARSVPVDELILTNGVGILLLAIGEASEPFR